MSGNGVGTLGIIDGKKLIAVDVSSRRDMHENVHFASFVLVKYVFVHNYVNICATFTIWVAMGLERSA